jgi:hypothetical protein
MSRTPHMWRPETRPEHCWDWITPEDVCRHALAAFYLAREAMKQPPGRRFVEADGTRWSGREVFGDNLAAVFELRLKAEGYQLGIEPDWANDAKQLQVWTRPRSRTPEELEHAEHPQPENTKVSKTHPGFPGYGVKPHVSEAPLTPHQHGQHSTADPAGSALDAVHLTQPSPERPGAP